MTKVTMPPVSVIVESDYELRWVGAEPIAQLVARTGAKPGSVFITTEQAEAYAAAKVREALEAAATIADAEAEAENARKQRYYPGVVGMLTECAADIRALPPPPA